MHSMVRFNILKRVKKWDPAIYGIPIPQVDQMPAGTMPAYLAAFKAMRKGRKHFTRNERAIVELSRYQCFLLGLPEELLPAALKASTSTPSRALPRIPPAPSGKLLPKAFICIAARLLPAATVSKKPDQRKPTSQ